MKRTVFKAICIITIFSMTVAFIIGSVALTRSTDYLSAEIKAKIIRTAENDSHNFSSKFNHMEGLTDSLSAHVSTSFDPDAFHSNPSAYLRSYKKDLSAMIQTMLSTSNTAHSLYVTFNPKLTGGNDEVWYAMVKDTITKIDADFETNKRKFHSPYAEDMAYFFKPQQKNQGIWTGPYFDQDIKEEVFSYSRAIYIDGYFIGVAGADITAQDTIRVVRDMKLYKSGYSALLDENFNFVVYPGSQEPEEKSRLSRFFKKELSSNGTQSSGILEYTLDHEDKILGYAKLDNGWTLIITQPKSEALKSVRSLMAVMLVLGITLAIILIAALLSFSFPFLKKQHSLEEENREKEIMLIYQSRQAKTGEMMGNITHQWKQPLNTINLILANLLDTYQYGDLDEARLIKFVSKVEKIVEKMSETITDFSDFLKPSKEKIAFDIQDCIKTALSLMEESVHQQQISVHISWEGSTQAFGYPNELTHVIFNLLNNARDAIAASGSQERNIFIKTVRVAEMLVISITNNGKSIPPHVMAHLFEPYFTTKSDLGGTGLGLYISRQIIEQRMDGKLLLENVPEGVCCRIELPTNHEEEV